MIALLHGQEKIAISAPLLHVHLETNTSTLQLALANVKDIGLGIPVLFALCNALKFIKNSTLRHVNVSVLPIGLEMNAQLVLCLLVLMQSCNWMKNLVNASASLHYSGMK